MYDHLLQVYIAEVAPAALRGLYSAITQLALAFGILLVYCIGWAGSHSFTYDYVALVAVGITAMFALLMVFFPETPHFLLTKNRKQQASKVLKWLRGSKGKSEEEMIDIEIVLSHVQHTSCVEFGRELTRRSACIPFVLMFFVMAFQQFCGINAFIFFAANIFQSAGLGVRSPFIALITIGFTELIFTLVTTFTVDLFGRKVLLVVSGLVMAIGCFSLGLAFYLTHAYPHKSLQFLAVISVVVFIIGFSLGWGAIPWTLVSEIFPLRIRGFLGGVVSAVNWACAALVTGFYFEYAAVVGVWGTWWTFGAVNLAAVVFVAIFVPETRGKPLEVIEHLMQNRYLLCSWK